MISDITLGQFFPGYSPLHRLDPRAKLIMATLFIVAVFLASTPVSFFTVALAVLVMILVSRISLKVILKGIKPIVFILIFTSILNLFMTTGTSEPFKLWIFEIYEEGIYRAIFMSLRVIFLIVGTSMLLTYTTSPISLTDGIESLLSPLKKIHVPVHTFAMMMSIALRFIPTLIEETEKIMNAQKSRGADFSSGGLIKRAKALIPILIPLFVSSFKRADELACAMECRCYRGDVNRTKLVKLEYKVLDAFAILFLLLFLGLIIFIKVLPDNMLPNMPIIDFLFYRI